MTSHPPFVYRGSAKHKRRPVQGRKGTRCPEWTHEADGGRLGTDMIRHGWDRTMAAELLSSSRADPEGSGKRYATRGGIAFAAHDTGDGTWHGYPVPWNDIPAELKELWKDAGEVSRRDLTRYGEFARGDIDWALGSDHA